MRKFATLSVFLLLGSSDLFAQLERRADARDAARVEQALPPIDHVSDRLNQTDEAKRALRSYHEGVRLGTAQMTKTAGVHEAIGTTRSFKVFVDKLDVSSRESRTFELKVQSEVAKIWVEVGELANGNVRDEVLQDLGEALLSRTPEGSINPNQGIIANNNQIFGNPPNADRDPSPIVDILLYDIPNQDAGAVLAGFVWSGDLCTTANAGAWRCDVTPSNQADVLYLDTDPLLTSFPLESLLEVAAHEYQHLIHFAYDLSEETFVNEGLSEWAERLNGYRGRSISYLSNESERNLSLLTWRSGTEHVLKDYQRAGLFTTYLAQRLGPAGAGSITKRTETGTASYRAALQQYDLLLEDVMIDFHTANLLNDVGIGGDGHFGYDNPFLGNVRSATSADRVIDGRSASNTPPSSFVVNGGGSVYARWEYVSDFNLTLDLVNASGLDYDRGRFRVLLEQAGSALRVEDIQVNPGGASVSFPGAFDAVTVIAAHVKPVSSIAIGVTVDRITVDYSATWGGGQQVESEIVQYDQGLVNGSFGFYILNGQGRGVVANRFTVPRSDAILGRIYVAPYFLSQFRNGNQPPEAPRDIELRIWADDGNGDPGTQLFSKSVTDTRDYPEVLNGDYQIRWHVVDLSQDNIPALPEIVHVGYSEAGSDQNYLVMGFANYAQENVSFIGEESSGEIAWSRLWDRVVRGEDGEVEHDFEGKVLPIRAEFLSGMIVDRQMDAELPTTATLDQNYPNPFNPVTSIRFALPSAQHVRLTIYDLTGRQIATLVDGTLSAGDHLAHFDGSRFASGVYVYVLETDVQRTARKMTLLR